MPSDIDRRPNGVVINSRLICLHLGLGKRNPPARKAPKLLTVILGNAILEAVETTRKASVTVTFGGFFLLRGAPAYVSVGSVLGAVLFEQGFESIEYESGKFRRFPAIDLDLDPSVVVSDLC